VPLFGKTRKPAAKPIEKPAPEEVSAQDFSLKLSYAAKSSESVRLKAHPAAIEGLTRMLDGYAQSDSELVEPLPIELSNAAPFIARLPDSAEWLAYHRNRLPVTRHALMVLELVDAIDLVFETAVLGLLDGEVDTGGYPEFNAVIGGVVSHWDETTGDMIVRAIVGWGGKGVRGDTERTAARLLAGIFNNVRAEPNAFGVVSNERPTAAIGQGGVACAHCGFNSGHERSFYCPKCGMRMLRD
jgi:hypothetical protein